MPVRLAAVLVALEGLALALLGAGYGVSGVVGEPQDRLATVLAGVLALLVGVALLPVARGLVHARGWALSPTIVVQVFVVVVAVGLLQGGVLVVAVPLLLAGGLVLWSLATRQAREIFRGSA